ncbi:MAG TPA: hypothetical protein VKN18_18180 [Blastocatellia bacterium]|nr:hypothetical protein [Blastocatellia bacterium]
MKFFSDELNVQQQPLAATEENDKTTPDNEHNGHMQPPDHEE